MNIRDPNLVKAGPFERINGKLKDSEYFFKVGILPEKVCKVEQHNWCKSFVLFASFIRSFDSLEISD